ncbi:unnamed protein product [Dimorphilus gyrociliatus]|uniref:Uncharacterized protein n=1 Tax=Dimorphilus gyrociliatus TaxID=2664684 RepID=A0A7I8V4N6_9ANNE|nr:unnamed protein product [Dimorphilus gyrociliatus]
MGVGVRMCMYVCMYACEGGRGGKKGWMNRKKKVGGGAMEENRDAEKKIVTFNKRCEQRYVCRLPSASRQIEPDLFQSIPQPPAAVLRFRSEM